MLQKEFQFYLANQEELLKKYKGKFIVIKDEQILGVYDSETEAYQKSREVHELGTFLIQLCLPGDEGYKKVFHSRVVS